jgi:hypothetical protein
VEEQLMSDHCQFPFFGVGQPMRMISAHPTVAEIGDLLGGAIPVPLITPAGRDIVGWVRETSGTEGQPRNPLASIALHILGGGGDTIVLGPCVITALVRQAAEPGKAIRSAGPEEFSPALAEGVEQMCADLFRALAGHDDGFTQDVLGEGWAESTRAHADRLAAMPVPDDYPYCGQVRVARDPVWEGVARAFGDGRSYVPMPMKR